MSGFEDNTEDISSLMRSITDYLEVDKKVHMVKAYAQQYPVMTLFWLVAMAMFSIPVICFCTFICASVFLTIAGFVLIEGTIVTVATVFLGGALLLAGLVALSFSSSLVVGFYALRYSLNLLQSLSARMHKPTVDTSTHSSPKVQTIPPQ